MPKSILCRSRRARCLLAVLVVSLVPAEIARAEEPRIAAQAIDCGRLEVGGPVERELKEGKRHTFQIEAASGDYLAIWIDQRGADVVATLRGPDGAVLMSIDRHRGDRDEERIDVVVPASGTCTLEIVLDDDRRSSLMFVKRYEALVKVRRPATAEDHKRAEARALLAETYRMWDGNGEREQLRRFVEHLEKGRLVFRDLGDYEDEARLLREMGPEIFYALGEVERGFAVWNRMLELGRLSGNRKIEVEALLELGWSAFNTSQVREHYYTEAYRLGRNIGDAFFQCKVIEGMGHRWNGINFDEALRYYLESYEIRHSLGGARACARVAYWVSWHYMAKRDFANAFEFANRSLVGARDTGETLDEVWALHHLGLVYRASGSPEKALPHLERALELTTTIVDVAQRHVLFELAESERMCGLLDRALDHVTKGMALFDGELSSVGAESLEFSMNAPNLIYYRLYVDILLQLHRRDPMAGYDARAFEVSEQARGRRLRELLARARVEDRGQRDNHLGERDRLRSRLDEALEAQIRLLNAEHTAEQEAAASNVVAELKAQIEQLEAKARSENPILAATRVSAFGVEDVQRRLLGEDTLLLEYLSGWERSFLLTVSKTSVTVYELPSIYAISTASDAVYRGLRGEGTLEEYESAAAKLSEMVLGPAAAEMGSKRLAIVSDIGMHQIPFAALPNPNTGYREPLVVRHEVTMLPSATAAILQRERLAGRAKAPESVAVLADPIFARNDSRVTRRSRHGNGVTETPDEFSRARTAWEAAGMLRKGDELVRLPWTRREAMRIVGAAPRKSSLSALDFDASERTAKSAALARYRVLHFATHGFLNSAQPELSGLVLSLVNERGEPEDGFLSTSEVFGLKLSAELVVLSGCETALGKQVAGEGMVGLTRAFMYAGAPRVIASLWAVQDEATAELMGRMYEGIYGRGLTPATALREAQVAMWRDPRWRAPRKWAAFVHQGDWLCPKL